MNLSNKQFTFPEYNLLNKNLNFCPSPGKYNKATLQKDIDAFTRRIKLKAHFNNENEPNDGRRKDFYIKSDSTWTPHNPHHTIKTFVEALTNEIKSLPDTNIDTRKNNLTKDETKALNDFQQRDDIVITKADKGGAVVIQDAIKLTFEHSYKDINFLDTTITISSNGRLETKNFKKPTDRSNYLHNTSYHPNSLKNNIPYGQALRLKKICTNEADYHKSLTDLEQAFLKRGYQKNHLSNQFQKASSKERSDLLSYKDKPEQERNLLFITTYNKSLPRIRYALNKHWNLLQINEELKGSFEQTHKLVYRRNKNIRDYIGQTTIQNNKVLKERPKTG